MRGFNQALSFVILSLIFAQTIPSVYAYTVNGNLIRDLESNGTNFAVEAASWNISGTNRTNIFSTCNGTYLMGGYNVLTTDGTFIRTYEDLPPHNMIYFSFYVTFIDQWYYNASFIVHFDYRQAAVGVFLFNHTENFIRDACGTVGVNDLEGLRMYGKIPHQDDSLTLRVWTLNHYEPSIRAFGFRDVTLLFRNTTKKDKETKEMCALAEINIPLNQCQCPEGEYRTLTGICKPCDSRCEICLGESNNQCLKCKPQAFFNGSACVQCHPSCQTCFGEASDQCLTCPAGYYMFEGSSCVDSCNAPLVPSTVGSVLYCSFPCAANQFLYSDGSCQNTCDFTYNSILWGGRKFCGTYCSGSLYYVPPTSTSGGACLASCPTGYYTDTVPRYCRPCQVSLCAVCPINFGAICQECQAGSILDTDGNCKKCDILKTTYVKAISTGYQYLFQLSPASCSLTPAAVKQHLKGLEPSKSLFPSFTFDVTLASGVNKYLVDLDFQDSVMNDNDLDVSLTHLSGTLKVPKKLVPSEELEKAAEAAPAIQSVLTSAVGVSFAGALALGSTASIWSMLAFQQFIGYFIYINIEYPYQVEIFLSLLGSSSFSFLPNPLATLTEPWAKEVVGDDELLASDRYRSPEKFAKNDVDSLFIDNGGSTLGTFVGLLLLLAALYIIRRFRKGKEHSLFKIVRTALEWNIIDRSFLEAAIPLLLAVCLQFRIINADNVYMTLCSISAVSAMLVIMAMVGFLFKTLYSQSIKELKTEVAKSKYGTLWEGIELKEDGSKYYHMLILARGFVLIILVVFFEEVPFLQIIPLCIFNAGLIYYLLKEANFEDKYLNIINRVKETLILLGEMFILGLNFKGGSETHYNTLGWLIVVCFSTALIIETTYMIGLQIKNIGQIKKKIIALWNAIKGWFMNMNARKRQRTRKIRRIYEKALQNDSMAVEMMHGSPESEPMKHG